MTNQLKFIDHCKDMALAYKISDIVVSASIEPEAFGRVAVEAQSMEKPIIASNIGGSNETIIDEKTGFLFESGNAKSLSKKIIKVLTMDESSLKSIGIEGRKNIIQKFNVEKMCFSTYSEYKRIIKLNAIITLPDGNTLNFPNKVTGLDVAEKISKSLAKQAMVISVNGELKRFRLFNRKRLSVKIFTSKNPEGLETIRHDTAHILAMAVQELFPGTQVTIGPVIENGFYYDFARKEPFTEDDLNKIENKMKEIVDRDEFQLQEKFGKEIRQYLILKKKEKYIKLKLLKVFHKVKMFLFIFMETGMILCRGPHLSSTGKIGKYFKLN